MITVLCNFEASVNFTAKKVDYKFLIGVTNQDV